MSYLVTSADITLVGGGMIGGATALALAPLGLKIQLIEAQSPPPFEANGPMEVRVSALYHGTIAYLKTLQVWPCMQNMRVCPFTQMSACAPNHAGMTFNAHEFGLDALGFFAENRVLQQALLERLHDFSNVTFLKDAKLIECHQTVDKVHLKLANGHTSDTRFLLGCDGAQSMTRSLAHIGITRWQYNQHCLTVIVKTQTQHTETWQQFTDAGPRAFLPLPEQHAALIWYDTPQKLQEITALPENAFIKEIRATFPQQLADFDVQNWGVFPLQHLHAHKYVAGRIALLGDAAHVIHPLVGQGVNLGFKDVQAFASEITTAVQQGTWQQGDWLQRYGALRQRDNRLMQSMMDALHFGHVSQRACAKRAMQAGFGLLQITPMKRALGHYLFGVKNPKALRICGDN